MPNAGRARPFGLTGRPRLSDALRVRRCLLAIGLCLLAADAALAEWIPAPTATPRRYEPRGWPPHKILSEPGEPASASGPIGAAPLPVADSPLMPSASRRPASPAVVTAMHSIDGSAEPIRRNVDPYATLPPIRLAQFDEPTNATFQPPVIPDELTAKAQLRPPSQVFAPQPPGPPRVFGQDPAWKPAFVKGGRGSVTYIPGSRQGLDWTTVDVLVGLRRPGGRAFAISPHFATHFTNGVDTTGAASMTPTGPSDLPSTFFDVSADIGLAIPLAKMQPGQPPRWLLVGGVSPGIFTDGENTSSDAFRLPGRALVVWNASEQWSWVFGGVYLDRDDVPFLPAVGVTWTPTPNLKLDLMAPRPKIAYRFQQRPDLERWATLSGELAGGQWAIERAGGVDDVVRVKATNLLFGIETRTATGLTWRSEFGLVVGREIEYESNRGNRELDSAAVFRVGSSF